MTIRMVALAGFLLLTIPLLRRRADIEGERQRRVILALIAIIAVLALLVRWIEVNGC